MKILLRNYRKRKGLSIVELSQVSGLSKSTISNIENGIVSPTMLQMENLARALDVRITDLFESDFK